MPINFPSNPSVDQTYTSSGTTWKYTGSAWKVEPADPGYATVAVSGSYNDLINKPTAFSALTALQFTAGVSVNEFSNDSTMADASATAVPTEAATKTYVDTAITNLIGAAPEVLNTLDELANAINDDSSFASSVTVALSEKEPTIAAGTTAQYWRGDKSFQTLNAAAVGLGNVTNESKATMFTSPSFTGTVSIGTILANSTVNVNGIVNASTVRESCKTGDLTVSGPYDMDCSLFNNWAFTVTGATSLSFSNVPSAGRTFRALLFIKQGTGGSISSFPSGTTWPGAVAPTLTTTNARTDIFSFLTVDGGTTWFASVVGQNYA